MKFVPFGVIGIVGSVIAKEGRMPDISSFLSGAFKVSFSTFIYVLPFFVVCCMLMPDGKDY